MKIKTIIFDLDDTLYEEITYVYSGFEVVANYFAKKYGLSYREFLETMIRILLESGRDNIFDKTLKEFNILSKKNVKKSVSLYRTHNPKIQLTTEAEMILKYFYNKNIPIYIITDGNKIVQNNKIQALELKKYIKKVFITHRYGIKHSKPSTYCFEKIANLERVNFNDIVYVGDNINKDFVNIKKIGFKTIRIKKGMFVNVQKEQEYHAEIDIYSLYELKNIIKTGEKESC